MGDHAIGDLPIGDIFGALAGVAASACVPGARFASVRARLKRMMERRGAQGVQIVRLDGGVETAVNALAIWLMMRPEDMIGEVAQADQTVIVDAAGFDGAGFALPLRKGDRVVRWPLQTREQAYTIAGTPHVETVGDYDLYYRFTVRG